MSKQMSNAESAGSNAGAMPKPDATLLRLHLIASHDLIPLNKPDARIGDKRVGKAPFERNWGRRRYDARQIEAWMRRGHNIGVCLRDDQLVVDVDPRNFDGSDRLAQLCAKFAIKLDDYPYVYTGGGGRHIYMSKARSLRIRGTLEGFPGIEFKSHGSQVVAAGSVHPESRLHYRAVDPFNDLAKPKEAPEELLKALARPQAVPKDRHEAMLSPEQIGELLSAIDPTKFREYNAWLHLMMACHHASGGAAVDEFVAWAISDPNFAQHETKNREKWDTLDCGKPNAISVGTLFKAVCDAGRPDLVAEILRRPAPEDFSDLSDDAAPSAQRKRFQELSLDDLSRMEAPKWLVRDLIPEGGLAVVYGQPKSCKTFWALGLALSVASGMPFHGLETHCGRVTYVAAEGGRARLYDRADAWERVHSADRTESFKLIAQKVDLTNSTEVAEFIATLDGPRNLIVIDTLARCMSGDENSQKDMGAFVAGCDRIREATGAAVLVVHHEGKDAGKGARGSNVLRGAVDAGIRARRDESGKVIVSVEDQRDGEPLSPMCFELRNVPLDGIERTSAALFDAESPRLDFTGAILAMATGLDGESKRTLDEKVAGHFKLHPSTAIRRTRDAIKIGRERAVRYHGFLIWFERMDPSNKRSGLVLHAEQMSDVVQADVRDI